MDYSQYRFVQHDNIYNMDTLSYKKYKKISINRCIYIRKNFKSYKLIMDSLSVFLYIVIDELDDMFYYIDKLISTLSINEFNSIIYYLMNYQYPSDYFVDYLRDSYIEKIKKYEGNVEYRMQVKNEILLTNFINHDVVNNVLFEYISYKKLMIYFSYYHLH